MNLAPQTLKAGLGIKPGHIQGLIDAGGAGLWGEVHPENYLFDKAARQRLMALAEIMPISLHGVSASLGGPDPLDQGHLLAFRALIDEIGPVLVSEHIAWSVKDGHHYSDLLPLPMTSESLAHLTERVDRLQTLLGRSVCVENPSQYLSLKHDWSEPEFLSELCERSGCKLLVDVNNVYVSAHNLGFDPEVWLDQIKSDDVHEIHLAGHEVMHEGADKVIIDTHSQNVSDGVWKLYERFIKRIGPRPTLIERDNNIPPLADLILECQKANDLLDHTRQDRGCHE